MFLTNNVNILRLIPMLISENDFDKKLININTASENFSPEAVCFIKKLYQSFARSLIILTITSTVFCIAKEGINSKRE